MLMIFCVRQSIKKNVFQLISIAATKHRKTSQFSKMFSRKQVIFNKTFSAETNAALLIDRNYSKQSKNGSPQEHFEHTLRSFMSVITPVFPSMPIHAFSPFACYKNQKIRMISIYMKIELSTHDMTMLYKGSYLPL